MFSISHCHAHPPSLSLSHAYILLYNPYIPCNISLTLYTSCLTFINSSRSSLSLSFSLRERREMMAVSIATAGCHRRPLQRRPAALTKTKSRRSAHATASSSSGGKGFSSSSSPPSTSSSSNVPENFFKVINRDEMKGKQTAAVVLANDNAYVVVSCKDKLYIVDAYSTVRTHVLYT